MQYFDAHCHVQFDAYDEDRTQLLAQLEEEEVGGIVVGVDEASSRLAVELVESHPTFFASVGLHPNRAHEPFTDTFTTLAQNPQVVAIGECGLDYFRPDEPEAVKKAQHELFEQHIDLAVALAKPLIIHARPSKGTMDAYQDVLAMLTAKKREHGERLTGDMHFFVGGIEEARAFVELDFTLSYTAVITFARDYDEIIRSIPLSHLLAETDSPYVAPASRRGTRNDPTAVKEVVEALAQIRGEVPEEVRLAVLRNASRVFKLSAETA